MVSRRERRERFADMELGRRHPYYYGGAGGVIVGLALTAAVGFVLLASWAIAPAATMAFLKWAAFIAGGALGLWLFWLVALRPRRRTW